MGPKELYKLSKEIGKLVATVRNTVAESAAEWQSTIDAEFEFEGLNDVKAAATELQDAFNFRSDRYMKEFSSKPGNPPPDPLAETAASQLDVDDWNSKIMASQPDLEPLAGAFSPFIL